MSKEFVIRVDLESSKGIKEGLPVILSLLKKHDLKASFYLTIGGESGIFDIIKYHGTLSTASERKIKVFSLFDKLRIVLFPRDFVNDNEHILKEIIEQDHELGIHGWKHRRWTRGLDELDINSEIRLALDRYKSIFSRDASSFSSPGFNTNKDVLKVLKSEGIKHISDYDGDNVEFIDDLVNVPITIKGKNNMPFIEYWSGEGKSDKEIFEIFKDSVSKRELCSIYMHGLYECRFKEELLDMIFGYVKSEGLSNKKINSF